MTTMVFVLVPRGKPIEILQMTAPQFVRMIGDLEAGGRYLATLPPWRTADEFEQAWFRYTCDMKHARRFASPGDALAYYQETADTLSMTEHARILTLLQELRGPA